MSDERPADESLDEGFAPPETAERYRVDDYPGEPDGEPEPVVEATDPITELTEEERRDLSNLLTVGRRTKTFPLFDFKIGISTLNNDDMVRVFRAAAQDEGTQAYATSYQMALVAAALRTVDGKHLENTLVANPDPEAIFQQKLDVVRTYYPMVTSYIYNEYIKLEGEFRELARKLGKL